MKATHLTYRILREIPAAGILCLVWLAVGTPSLAQQRDNSPAQVGGPGGMQRDPGAGPGQFDAAQIQQRLLETVVGRFQRELESTDEEWMVIHPLLGKVLNLEFAGLRELIGRMGGRGGIPLLSGGQPEVNALRDALAKPETSTEELEAKMKAVRDARKKNEEALRKAREDLRKVLTMRQEAKLVLAGILD